MKKYTKEETSEVLKTLPSDVQEAILSEDSANAVYEVGQKYGLHVDIMGELGDETGLVMLGLTPTDEFVPNLVERLHISREVANGIAGEINERIFKKIQHHLLAKRQGPEKADALDNTASLSREALLRAIEHPDLLNVQHATSLSPTTAPLPASDVPHVSPANPPTEKPEIVPAPAKPLSIVEEKLQGTVAVQSEQKVVSDPYRESVE
jgi:hypothetical protein